jgi:hypothetical protein
LGQRESNGANSSQKEVMINHFPTPNDLKSEHFKTLCPHEDVLFLYNNEAQRKVEYIDKVVVDWIEAEAARHGWKGVEWFNDSCTGRGCWISLRETPQATVKSDPKPIPSPSIDEALSRAFTRIAQHACRQGETNDRCWPDLAQLPELDSWKMVGSKYAREFAIELMTIYFSNGNFLQDLAQLAGRES